MFVELVESEDVLKAVTARGPMIPMEVRKFLGKGDSITIGAELSTLQAKGLVKKTHVKMGGSSFYYVKGQENKLELLNKYLNDKDKRTFEDLRQKKVMKDFVEEPLTRVSLRNMPDFAKKLIITNNDESILYWYWYLITEDDAISLIKGEIQKKDLSLNVDNQIQTQQNTQVNSQQNYQTNQNSQPSNYQHINTQQNNQQQTQAHNFQQQHTQNNHNNIQIQNQNRSSQLNSSQSTHISGAFHQSNHQSSHQPIQQTHQSQQIHKDESIFHQQENQHQERKTHQSKSNQIQKEKIKVKKEIKKDVVEEQKTITQEIIDFDDDFFYEIKAFFEKNHIKIKTANMIRKSSEYEFVIEMKTPFGETEYFCKAKSKKKCNEGDLSSAYLQGQNKRMPTVFLTTGEITKKAKQLAKDEYKGLLVKEL